MTSKLALLGLIVVSTGLGAADDVKLRFSPEAIGVPPLSLGELIGKGALTRPPLGLNAQPPATPRLSTPRPVPLKAPERTMPIIEPDPKVDYKIVVVPPDPDIDFKMATKEVYGPALPKK